MRQDYIMAGRNEICEARCRRLNSPPLGGRIRGLARGLERVPADRDDELGHPSNPRWKSRAILRNLYEGSAAGIRISNTGLREQASDVRAGDERRTRSTGRRTKVLARTRDARTRGGA